MATMTVAIDQAVAQARQTGRPCHVVRMLLDRHGFWMVPDGQLHPAIVKHVVYTPEPERRPADPACDTCGTTEGVETAAPFGPELAVTRCRACWEHQDRFERDVAAGARRRR
jgi:hypothetical protein